VNTSERHKEGVRAVEVLIMSVARTNGINVDAHSAQYFGASSRRVGRAGREQGLETASTLVRAAVDVRA
jgi:hypothetical protein